MDYAYRKHVIRNKFSTNEKDSFDLKNGNTMLKLFGQSKSHSTQNFIGINFFLRIFQKVFLFQEKSTKRTTN